MQGLWGLGCYGVRVLRLGLESLSVVARHHASSPACGLFKGPVRLLSRSIFSGFKRFHTGSFPGFPRGSLKG